LNAGHNLGEHCGEIMDRPLTARLTGGFYLAACSAYHFLTAFF
jgi:hypothetical protein